MLYLGTPDIPFNIPMSATLALQWSMDPVTLALYIVPYIYIYYTPKCAIWAFEQFDWFTLTVLWLHITLIYLLWHIQAAHIAWIYLLWWIQLIRQQSVVNCSSSGWCSSADLLTGMLQMMDSLNFNLKSLYSQSLKQCWRFYCHPTWACLFTSSSFNDFAVFPRSASVSTCYVRFNRADSQE